MSALSEITEGTRVSFPSGATEGTSTVVYVQDFDQGHALVIVAETPFHPVSHTWPDQQADYGTISTDGVRLTVVDTLTGAKRADGGDELYLDTQIPVRKFDPEWIFFVAHRVELPAGVSADNLLGASVALSVDAKRRVLLSATHTATHLAGLAVNKNVTGLWRKETPLDALGHGDLDRLAMDRSVISPGEATDRYRFGKSFRKKTGFEVAEFFETADQFTEKVNQQVNDWIAGAGDVVIKTGGPSLAAPRWWTCTLDDVAVEFPCGGTHVSSFGEFENVQVEFEFAPEQQEIVMHTIPTLRR